MAASGYAGRILSVDLSTRLITEIPTVDYSDRFLGGRGLAAKMYWDQVLPQTAAFDEANALVFAVGPLAGVPVIGGSRWVVCGKSHLTEPEHFCYANLGGRWGAEMKFAGYDAVTIHGKSDKPVYILLDGASIEFCDASGLWGKGAIDTRQSLKRDLGNAVKVVAIGPAGENLVPAASILADNDASGSGGLGAAMGSMNLKAIAVRAPERRVRIAQPETLKELIRYFRQLKRVPLPISPYRCTIDDEPMLNVRKLPGPKMRKDPCYGCLGMCPRRLYETREGESGKFVCDSAMFYQPFAEKYYGEWNDVPFHATKLCDNFGLDAVVVRRMIGWLQECYELGTLNDSSTGLALSKVGSLEFINELVRKVSFREGFGDEIAARMEEAVELRGCTAEKKPASAGAPTNSRYDTLYDPRLFITTGLLYAMEPRTPVQQLHHLSFLVNKWICWAKGVKGVSMDSKAVRAIAKRFFGSELAADFSTYEGKALAAKMIQDRDYAMESLILCDWLFPIMDLDNSEDLVGDPAFESSVLSAVTGKNTSEQELYRIGERVFNLQRAIMVREGHNGRKSDQLEEPFFSVPVESYYFSHECLMPGRNGELISRKGNTLERARFERVMDEYYRLRGWDVHTGQQTMASLAELDLNDVANDLKQRRLAR